MADEEQGPAADGGQSSEQSPDAQPRRAPKAADGAGKDSNAEPGEHGDARGKREGSQNKRTDEREPLGDGVYQGFHGTIYAPNATFGISAGAAGDAGQRGRGRDEGPLGKTDIAGIVRTYAKPGCYDLAEQALRDKHVVILTGETGSGRRAGGIVLLDGVRGMDKPLVRINPSITLRELAVRPFDEGTGYLISEKFAEQIAPELAEFHWDALCHKIRKAKAHLVVTAGPGSIIAVPDAVGQVSWQRPEAADALRAHLGASHVPDDVVRKVAEALGTGYVLAGIGAIARRILAGEDVENLLDEFHGGAQKTVADWLESVKQAMPAVLEVAALAFILGVTERVFEDEVADLKLHLADFAPELDTESKEIKSEIDLRFRWLRKQRADHKLLNISQVPVARTSGFIGVRHVDFRQPEYRRYVIAELWYGPGRDFWAGMRRWLHGIVAADHYDALRHADLMNSSAIGLALLALVAPDEVIDSYLIPWTDEGASASEQTMAVYVVWRMSMLDQTAPLALHIAILWAGQGPPAQRRLAAYAFSGELGARYPVEATKRLSQLADQKEPLVSLAFARLFAALATQGGDAVVVLGELRRRMADKKDRRSAELVLDTVVELAAARDFRTGRPAVAVFLNDNPGRVADIGALWARVLYMRPWRDRAIRALVATVWAIGKPAVGAKAKPQPPVSPDELAFSLGAAIGTELPQPERVPLQQEIRRWVDAEHCRQKRDRMPRNDGANPPLSPNTDEVLEKLLIAIVHPSPQELGK